MSARGSVGRTPRHAGHAGCALLATLLGCTQIAFGTGGAGGDAATSNATTSGGGGATSGGGGGVGASGGEGGSTMVPEGWFGPVELGVCDAPEEVLIGAVEAPSTCGCTCAASCDVAVQQYPFPSCFTLSNTVELVSGVCQPLANNTASLRFSRDAACTVSATPEPISVETATLCASPAAACIHRDGDEPCPTTHPMKTTLFRSVLDARACDDQEDGCSCTATCEVEQAVFPNASCQGSPQIVANDQCLASGQLGSVLVESTAMCVSSGESQAVGDVMLDEPVTVCCP